MRVSIVIPAYNEESHLQACLQAIAAQTAKPFEVIVVDNNSTDNTAAIARSFPFVRLISEPRQGVAYARDAGFNAARGEIIGRIDVDTHVSPQWVADIQAFFADSHADAVSGSVSFHDVPFKNLFGRVDILLRTYLARSLQRRGELFLYGANMALRRSAWLGIRRKLCHNSSFHEDIDMAAHFAHSAYTLAFEPRLHVSVSARRVDSAFRSFYPYVWANSATYAAHCLRGRFFMYPVQLLATLGYVFLRPLYRMYDAETDSLSLQRAWRAGGQRRVSPVAETP